MNFWDLSRTPSEDPVVIGPDGSRCSRDQLRAWVTDQEAALERLGPRTLGFVLCDNRLADLALYLACLRRGHVPLLLASQTTPEQLAALLALYRPHWVFDQGVPKPLSNAQDDALHPDLGLLLSTSGTTGSPRLVRLARSALQANAASIAAYLQLGPRERAVTSLPMHYSYGLSVINSHLLAGGSLVLNTDSVISREFLQRLREQEVTSLAGVPYTYQMLHRTGFFQQDLPQLRTLTQAGGRLDEKMTRLVAEHARACGRRFFVMYGQTEATARMSYVPPDRLLDKVGSIGRPIPGGMLELDAATGELIYRGPNVMMGYAQSRADLARGDDCHGRLATGDLGHVDADGFFYVTGRLKRFVKVSGNRIGLDEVEQALQALLQLPMAVGGADDRLMIWVEGQDPSVLDQVRDHLRRQYAIHPTMTRLQLVDHLPLLPSGKKDYGALTRT